MGIAETLEYIHSVKWQGSKPGLDRTIELLHALGDPQKSLKFVHIAGTNGKGSTAACIASVLQCAGYRTGLYISPYILRFNERMQVNGVHISDDELVRFTDEIRPFADAMADSPTEFELITALAMKYFLHMNCDIVVLEVGMGGQLDSTNVIDTPEVAVITTIGFDHVSELGPTIIDIAGAKAGIIKKDGDVVMYGGSREVDSVFETVCKEQDARLRKADFSRIADLEFTLEGTEFDFSPYGKISLPLAGTYQPFNAALAITAIEVLCEKGYRIDSEEIIEGIGRVRWPGRFEILGREPVFILDGAHNPQAVKVTAESLRRHFGDRKIVFLAGVMADKDIDTMMQCLVPLAESFIALKPDYYRAMDAHALAERLSSFGVPSEAYVEVAAGVKEAINRAGKCGIVCAVGSLYFSGDIRVAYTAVSGMNPPEKTDRVLKANSK